MTMQSLLNYEQCENIVIFGVVIFLPGMQNSIINETNKHCQLRPNGGIGSLVED